MDPFPGGGVARSSSQGEKSGKTDPGEASAATYDALVARLEQVVEALERGDLALEQSVERFAEGIALARQAGQKLDEAERRVELLVKGAEGETAVPLEPDRT
jgi:exodeoxyribonuclease VII small subunit